jgi:hypothetical protein
MGFRDLKAFNTMCKSNSLVARILKARYFPNSSFLDCNLGHNTSCPWWRIGDGASDRVMNDP